jgi:hypothetical protein
MTMKFKAGDKVLIKDRQEAGIQTIDYLHYENGMIKFVGSWFWYNAIELTLVEAAAEPEGEDEPQPAPVASEPTVTISLSDAYQAHTALVALVNRLNEHMDDPDYEGNKDNLVRLIQETEAVLDRLTAQVNAVEDGQGR